MRTYGDVVDSLARSVALLVSTPVPVQHPDHLMVARNAIYDGVRHTVDALVGARVPPTRPRIADLELDPVGAFRSALHVLPRVPSSIGLADVAADQVLPRAWIQGAAAALELTRYDEALRELHASARWAPLRDLADITTSVVQVDMDLRRALPGMGLPRTRPLVEVQITAGATILEARTRGGDRAARNVPEPIPAWPCPIRRAADIPVALDRIAAMIQVRGSSITMHDLGVVVVNMAQSLDDASKILRRSAERMPDPEPVLNAADRAEETRGDLAGLARLRNCLMTLGPADPCLVGLMLELRGAMRSLLEYSAGDDGALNPGPGRVCEVLARQTSTITSALAQALCSAATSGQLLVRDRFCGPESFRWTVAKPSDERLIAVLDALAATTDAGNERITALRPAPRSVGLAVDRARAVLPIALRPITR